MSPAVRAALFTFLGLTVYFVAGSMISDSMRFPYGYVSAGGLLLFALSGFFIAQHDSASRAAAATAVAALAASLAAWIILGLINPMFASQPRPRAAAVGEVIVLMTVSAYLVGWAGAWLGTRSTRHRLHS
jgi:hypothetical protein